MKFGVLNKSTILNRFVLDTLQRNITHLAVITRKTNIKLGILKGGETGKEPASACILLASNVDNPSERESKKIQITCSKNLRFFNLQACTVIPRKKYAALTHRTSLCATATAGDH